MGSAESAALLADVGNIESELSSVIIQWDKLSNNARAEILAIIDGDR